MYNQIKQKNQWHCAWGARREGGATSFETTEIQIIQSQRESKQACPCHKQYLSHLRVNLSGFCLFILNPPSRWIDSIWVWRSYSPVCNLFHLFTGKWYWKWEQCKRISCFVDLLLSVSYFLLLRYDLWHVTFSVTFYPISWLLIGGMEDQKVARCVALWPQHLQHLTFYLPACVATSCWNSFSIC